MNNNIKAIPLFSEKVLASFTVFYRTNTSVFLIFFNTLKHIKFILKLALPQK